MSKTRLRRVIANRFQKAWMILVWILFLLAACKPAASHSVDLAAVFAKADLIPGWVISQSIATYDRQNLFNLVDGQAESFFAYGFEQVAVQRYQDQAGNELIVEIWQLATPDDAYGLFSAGRAGTAAAIGSEGDADPGRRLAFWQDRFFVSLSAIQPLPDATFQAFGQAVSTALPSGGETPALVARLPQSGLMAPPIFFHEEMSVQMEVWLGGENLLGLSQETNGVVGRYELNNATARLLLIEYPSSTQAAAELKALQGSELADLVLSAANGKLLGAVFGKADPRSAEILIQDALK
jgi:hypothetical protein